MMQLHGIKARGKRKFVVTTDSKHNLPIAPNLLERNFTPEAPNTVWTSDITYIATDEGWLYLTAVIDLFSRQVVGWSMKEHMQTSVVTDALRMAWFRRRPAPGLIFHSDRGSQYCSQAFQDALKGYEMKSSMSRKRGLLGQHAHREPVGPLEGWQTLRQAVCHTPGRHGRGDRLADVLQLQEVALDSGLRQPDDVREALDRGPAATKEVRIMGSLWSPGNRGKVSDLLL